MLAGQSKDGGTMLRSVSRLIPVAAVATALCVPLTGAHAASCSRKQEKPGCALPTGTVYSSSPTANPTATFAVTAPGRRTVRGLGPVQTYWQVSGAAVCNPRLQRDVVFDSGLNKRIKVGSSATSTQTGSTDRQFKSLRVVMTLKVVSASRATLSGTAKATFADDPVTGRPLLAPCNRQFSISVARRS
jgi:hypothetical protein